MTPGLEEFATLLEGHAEGEALRRLALFAGLLERWSSRHNLVRYSSREELVNRHIVDALAATPFLGPSGRLLDVGSGAGLPGVPLLAARPGWRGVLLEPRQKRWAFLRTVIRELGLDARAQRARYQDLTDEGPFDVITVRAVGGPEELVDNVRSRLTPSGEVFLWTTAERVATMSEWRGWRVLSSQLPGLECGRLARLQPCFT